MGRFCLKNPKKSVLKYFEPVDVTNILKNDFNSDDISESFGYFAHLPNKNKLFLNVYSIEKLTGIMNKSGLTDHLKSKGYTNLLVDIDIDEALIYYLKIYNDDRTPDNLLIDLRLSDSRFVPDKRFFEPSNDIVTLDMVVIEWLSMQNPKGYFTKGRPQLPGQTRPGLGCLQYLMKMMYIVAEGVIKDGFLDVPDHMHGAVMYSRNFKFFNPSHEAILRAIMRDLKQHSLYDLSWGMITESIIDKNTGLPQVYDPSEQLFPVSKRLKDYYKSKRYVKKFKKVYARKKYYMDVEKMQSRRIEMIRQKNPSDL